ncbi:MAG: hypothetical protein IID40_07965 [Planctomycetes bacterium]|nr:hypothetical protein [Planctomycetota bacterium]
MFLLDAGQFVQSDGVTRTGCEGSFQDRFGGPPEQFAELLPFYYDAARLLLSGLFDRLAPQLGGDFLVATPARDMFVAMSRGPHDFVDRLHDRVAEDFKRMPYPITSDFFYVTRDGVAGALAAA